MKYPNLYVNDLTVDLGNSSDNYMTIISNDDNDNYDSSYDYDYWAKDIHINNCKFIKNNTILDNAYIKMATNTISKKQGKTYNYTLTNCVVNLNNISIILQCMKNLYKTKDPVNVDIKYINAAKNTVTIYKDGNEILNKMIDGNNSIGTVLNEDGMYKVVVNSEISEESGVYLGNVEFDLNIDHMEPIITVSYSETKPTRNDIIVTISSNEKINNIDGWDLSEDRLTLTKTYSSNVIETIEIYDDLGNKITKTIEIANIDKEAPQVEVSYSTAKPTSENVVVTISADEQIKPVDGWTIDSTKKILTKIFTINSEEQITITDLAGNTKVLNISITNIDTQEIMALVEYSTTLTTNKDVIVNVKANKKIKEVEGWKLTDGDKTLTKVFSSNNEEEVELRDFAGNVKKLSIKVTNIDKISPKLDIIYANNNNNNITATIISDEEIREVEGWILSETRKSLTKTYSSNVEEEIEIRDLADNLSTIKVKIDNIINETSLVEEENNNNSNNKYELTQIEDSTITKNKIPKAGKVKISILFGIMIFIIIAWIYYRKIKKYKVVK